MIGLTKINLLYTTLKTNNDDTSSSKRLVFFPCVILGFLLGYVTIFGKLGAHLDGQLQGIC